MAPSPLGPSPHNRRSQTPPGKRRRESTSNEEVFNHLLLQWIVANDISFRVCEGPCIRGLYAYLATWQPNCSGVYRAIPPLSAKVTLTDRRWVTVPLRLSSASRVGRGWLDCHCEGEYQVIGGVLSALCEGDFV